MKKGVLNSTVFFICLEKLDLGFSTKLSTIHFEGVVIYARCERWCGDLAVQQARSAIEKRKLRPVASTVPLTGAHLTNIDAVFITRYYHI